MHVGLLWVVTEGRWHLWALAYTNMITHTTQIVEIAVYGGKFTDTSKIIENSMFLRKIVK